MKYLKKFESPNPKVKNWKDWQKPFEGKLNENKLWYKNLPEILEYLSFSNNTLIFIDTETTGLGGPKKQQLTQIAGVAVDSNLKEIGDFNEKIKLTDDVKKDMDYKPFDWAMNRKKVLSFNRYGDKIKGKNYINEQDALNSFFEWVKTFNNPVFVIQNAQFDMNMFGGRSGKKLEYPVLDLKMIIQLYVIPVYEKLAETDNTYKEKLEKIGTSSRDNGLTSSSMGAWAPEFGIETSGYHDALYDCRMTVKLYENIINLFETNKDLDISKYQNIRISKSLKYKDTMK